MRHKLHFSPLSLVLATLCLAGFARAGTGTISLPEPEEGSQAKKISLKVTLTTPPNDAQQLENAKEQLRLANKILCDATDGEFRISDVTFLQGEGALRDGDIWWFPVRDFRAEAGGLGNFGIDAQETSLNPYGSQSHIKLYGYNITGLQSDFFGSAIAHEMSHAVFGGVDAYANQRPTNGVCPRGVSFAFEHKIGPFFRPFTSSGTFSDRQWGRHEYLEGELRPVFELADDGFLEEETHSLLQTAFQYCVDASGRTPSQYKPGIWSNKDCTSDFDCVGEAPFSTCPSASGALPPLTNEFAGVEAFDQLLVQLNAKPKLAASA